MEYNDCKVGMRVECVQGNGNAKVGDLATITRLEDGIVFANLDTGYQCGCLAKRFEPLSKRLQKQIDTTSYEIKLASPVLLNLERIYKETITNDVRVARVKVADGYYLLVQHDILLNGMHRKGGKIILRKLSELDCLYFGGMTPIYPKAVDIQTWGKAYELVKALSKAPILVALKHETTVTVEPFTL